MQCTILVHCIFSKNSEWCNNRTEATEHIRSRQIATHDFVLYTRLKNIPYLFDLMQCVRQVIFPALPSKVRREDSGNFSYMFSNAVRNGEWTNDFGRSLPRGISFRTRPKSPCQWLMRINKSRDGLAARIVIKPTLSLRDKFEIIIISLQYIL